MNSQKNKNELKNTDKKLFFDFDSVIFIFC